MKKTDPKFVRAFDRAMLRSQFVSLFWSVIAARRKTHGFKMKSLADSLGKNKGEVSRWFSGDPNWTVNTIASLAHALNVDLKVEAVDRETGEIFTAAGSIASGTQVKASGRSEIDTPESQVIFLAKNGHWQPEASWATAA